MVPGQLRAAPGGKSGPGPRRAGGQGVCGERRREPLGSQGKEGAVPQRSEPGSPGADPLAGDRQSLAAADRRGSRGAASASLCPVAGAPAAQVQGSQRESSQPGPAPAAAAGIFGWSGRVRLCGCRTLCTLHVFTVVKQQQEVVAEEMQLLPAMPVGQMLAKCLSLSLLFSSCLLLLNISSLDVVENVIQLCPFCSSTSPAAWTHSAACVWHCPREPQQI